MESRAKRSLRREGWIASLILKDFQEFATRFKVHVVSSDFEKLLG